MPQAAVALVTGVVKRRIGWHVAQALAARGYHLALQYRTSAVEALEIVSELRNRGLDGEALHADVTDEASVRAMTKKVLERFGRIDVLGNCAAVWKRKPLEDVTAD